MKVFRVCVDDFDYCECGGFVVVAESEEEIRKKFKENEYDYQSRYEYRLGEEVITFTRRQAETLADIHIEEVDLTKESIVFTSFGED